MDTVVGAETLFFSELTRHWSSHGELAEGSRSYREAHWKLTLHSGVSS